MFFQKDLPTFTNFCSIFSFLGVEVVDSDFAKDWSITVQEQFKCNLRLADRPSYPILNKQLIIGFKANIYII